MESELRIKNLDESLVKELKRLSESTNVPVNLLVIKFISDGLGVDCDHFNFYIAMLKKLEALEVGAVFMVKDLIEDVDPSSESALAKAKFTISHYLHKNDSFIGLKKDRLGVVVWKKVKDM